MKAIFILTAAVLLSGCTILQKYPDRECDHWVHTGTYGPFLQTHFEATAAAKTDKGLHLGTWSSSWSVLGVYGASDTIQGLTLGPLPPSAAK